VGWSDLGWAMENLWTVSMGRQFFCIGYVHGWAPNKNPCIKILIIKVNKLSKLSNANDAIEASTLFIQQQEVVESQQIQYNQLESSSVS
jgi:hypothetical protein